MTIFKAIASGYKNYFNFEARASRSEYWMFFASCIIIFVFLLAIDFTRAVQIGIPPMDVESHILSSLFILTALIPLASMATRRLHDVGKTGWWQLILITGIGIPILLYWYVKRGALDENRYGSNSQNSNSNCRINKKSTPNTFDQRLNEEKLYDQVIDEMDNEDFKPALWSRAISHATGNERKARSLYIFYRGLSIQNEGFVQALDYSTQQDSIQKINIEKEKELWFSIVLILFIVSIVISLT